MVEDLYEFMLEDEYEDPDDMYYDEVEDYFEEDEGIDDYHGDWRREDILMDRAWEDYRENCLA